MTAVPLQSSAIVKHCIDLWTQALEVPADAEIPNSDLLGETFSARRCRNKSPIFAFRRRIFHLAATRGPHPSLQVRKTLHQMKDRGAKWRRIYDHALSWRRHAIIRDLPPFVAFAKCIMMPRNSEYHVDDLHLTKPVLPFHPQLARSSFCIRDNPVEPEGKPVRA